jgi:hypothetical protein
MSEPSRQDPLPGAIRVMQVIVVAMTGGCLMFAVVAILLNLQDGPMAAQPGSPIVTYIALAVMVSMLIAFVVARAVLNGQARRSLLTIADRELDDSSDPCPRALPESSEVVRILLGAFQTRLLMGAALLEGAAFFLLISYLLEGSPLALASALFLILGIALQFPTQSRVAGWIEKQLQSIHNERQFRRS